ncbi:cyclin-D4-1-like [Prosopis cineraria]|uniref:cyclin-D4-1-like n=1 Tax=Prosopis cineraria TaxID=364024 RepID=UPI0024107690|nr:cyclin-D4-1-like [Prosopis cineraria]XP_054795615.1 cyclin-D4-1-like [Prosopis cineraria]
MSLSSEYSPAGNLFCCEDAADVLCSGEDASIFRHPSSSPYLLPYSPPSDEITIAELIDVESRLMPDQGYFHRLRDCPIDFTNRDKSINWIFKVHAYYQFRPVTALLSVNYFDRFLSCAPLPPAEWPFHLLSVGCLSLAAKMEEPRIPNLPDLQIFDPGFVFDSKTVQRMELRILTQLNWRLRSVTPFDYLHYFFSKLPTSSSDPKPGSATQFFRASQFILATARVTDFLRFAPSSIAAAAVLCSAGVACDVYPQSLPCFHDRVNKEMVGSCHQLMEAYMDDTCREAVAAPPSSPMGVLDAAAHASSDTRSENAGSTTQADQPRRKRLRSSAPNVQRV